MSAPAPAAPTVWTPEGTSRGTVVVLPGRGEHPGVYARLGRRLSFDGWTVSVPDLAGPGPAGPVAAALGTGGTRPTGPGPDGPTAIDGPGPAGDLPAPAGGGPAPAADTPVPAAGTPGGAGPVTGVTDPAAAAVNSALDDATGARVLLGSDTGALRVLDLVASGSVRADAVVLAGLPAGDAPTGPAPGDHVAELDARTACPIHRGVLEADPDFRWGELADPVPAPPGPALPDTLPDLPVLWLHGDADPIAPVAAVRALARGTDDLAVVADGVHDVLNDQFHRIVAARLVQFLERVAKGARFVEPAPAAPASGRRAAPLQVSARLDHAMRGLAELVASGDGPVTCEAISRARGVPLNSLVNVMLQLRRAGLVTSRRGCEGGYRLARPAAEITVADVVRATEGSLAAVRDTGPAAPLWADLERTVADFLTTRTLTALTTEAPTP
ncbi:transcriptional regulator, BadM/Rrf2 family [Pseudonocardia ammonioxydans]|uniref:Transcriptional regulator, BadM/Rrf2 family n=1 Tax=Pseudonocardia ammonioxydans TaxID=260086 RepID=A0A1I5BDB0_PSUAM|nr:Rrf2 family transcriptional regulator [Pseudonocardia ammonioxydans]SFN72682.1 transcriptional regulator, BadM/Rrf2 family [Pseudonocardia ammonioxydans]